MPETWGLLPKSQVDDELIEEAIARLVLEHNEDETAHLDTGQSLQSHKASEIIDHVVQSVVTDKLKDLAVTTGKINNLAVTTEKVNDLAVTEAKIGSLAVTEGKIGSLSISTAKIQNLAITELKIGDLAVTNAKIGNLSITSGKIQDLAVTNAKIDSLAVTEAKIGSLAVTEGKIANLAVTEGKIGNLAVTNAKIANLAVDDAKISNLTVEKLTGTYLTGKFVRTAASGQRVQMNSSSNSLEFYDSGGSLGGTILGQSNKIYVSGGGFNVECEMWLEATLHPDVVDTLIPISNNAYDLGASSYKWRYVYVGTKLVLNTSTPTITGDVIPDTNSYNDLGFTNYKWYRVFRSNEVACPMPTANSAIGVYRKIKSPQIYAGDYGERHYFKDTDFPDEMKLIPNPEKGGEVEIEMTRTLGVTVQAVRELIDEVDKIKEKLSI